MIDNLLSALASDRPFTGAQIADTNWTQLYNRVINDGIASLIYTHLSDVRHKLSANTIQFFRTHYENALIFKELAVQILKDLQPALSSAGTIVLTQGLALSETVYPEPMCRSMGDIDLFLPDCSVQTVGDIFLHYGFTRYRGYKNVLEYNQIMVDLHEGLWGTDRFTQREYGVPKKTVAWQPSKLIPGLFVLCPEDLALHCSFHGLKHGFYKGIWDCDLLRLYNAGYLRPFAQTRQEYMLKYMTFEHLRYKKISPVRMSEKSKYHISPVVKAAAYVLVRRSSRPGTGQLLLALLCPSVRTWVRYLCSIILPPKNILQQMYGRYPFPILFFKRIRDIITYIWKALIP